MYYALAQSLIQYGISGWGGMYDVHLKSLKTIQNSILKVILKKPYLTSTSLIYKESGLLEVRKLYTKFILKYTHTNKNIFGSEINNSSTGIKTRNKVNNHLVTYKAKKKLTQRHGIFLGAKLYNLLPPNICNESKLKLFTILVKDWLLNITIESINNEINNRKF